MWAAAASTSIRPRTSRLTLLARDRELMRRGFEFVKQHPAHYAQLSLQRALTTPYTGKCTWDEIFAATRAVGARHTVWGSDLGQVFNPPVEDGLALMADRFLEAGFSDEEVRTMAVENTRRLAGA